MRGKAAREREREREGVTRRGRESSVLFARDGRVAIATGGCLLLRPAVVGWYRAVYREERVRDPRGPARERADKGSQKG